MSNYKGVVDAIIYFAVIALAFFLIIAVNYIGPKTHLVEIQKSVDLFVNNEDRGTGIHSFLSSKKSSLTYAEILGDMKAMDKPDDIDQDVIATLKQTEPETILIVTENDQFLAKYGTGSENLAGYLFADIALPGGLKGEVGIR